ncbi:MAG: hypothetical protein ACI9G1_006083 [Pirellulaceae bacterium]|jgi:hypothetical protein
MTNIDQFESVFKSADKTPFAHESIKITRGLIVTDLPSGQVSDFVSACRSFTASLGDIQWQVAADEDLPTVPAMLEMIERQAPEVIVIYRNLFVSASEHPYSLGAYVDVVTQATDIPVLLLPHPETIRAKPELLGSIDTVMAVTDHLAGDHHLVSYGCLLTPKTGNLVLAHIEDDSIFQRYMDIIGKIPNLDTDVARHDILAQLLKEPTDYIQSCREVFAEEGKLMTVESVVRLGCRMKDYKKLLFEHKVDLMILNTKDNEQLAMHGVAYPLAVELRETPLLLL